MADNFVANAGSGGDTFGADDIGGTKFPRIKLIVGADGTNDGDVASGNPLPVSATALTTLATTVKAEDAASAGGDAGLVVMGMRQDSPAATSGTDGDYEPLRIVAGKLAVDASLTTLTVAAHAVTNAGTFAVQAAQSGTWNIGTVATVTNVVHVDDNAGSLTVDGTVTASIAAGATTIAKAEDVASADADVGVPSMAVRKATPANTSGTDGDYEFLQMSVGRLWTSSTIDAALPAGTNAIGKLAANSGVDIGDVDVTSAVITGGAVAHDAADSGNPIKIGFRAETSPKGITLVADGDRADAFSDADGMLLVKPWTSGADRVSERIADTGGTSTNFSNFTAVASTYNNITDVTIHNAHATTNGFVDLRDGSAGSVIWTFPAPATGGCHVHFDPPLKQPTANTALAYDVSAAITTVYISVNGFQSKV